MNCKGPEIEIKDHASDVLPKEIWMHQINRIVVRKANEAFDVPLSLWAVRLNPSISLLGHWWKVQSSNRETAI